MATLRYFPPNREPQLVAVHKPVTTLGRELGNDLHLEESDVAEHHAQIVFDGRDFQLEEIDKRGEILINGKKIGSSLVRPRSGSVSSAKRPTGTNPRDIWPWSPR